VHPSSPYLKKAAAATLVLMTLLLIGAFNIINTHTLQIRESRYGSFAAQLFPLIAAYLHLLPVQAIPKDVAVMPGTTFYGPWVRADIKEMRRDIRIGYDAVVHTGILCGSVV